MSNHNSHYFKRCHSVSVVLALLRQSRCKSQALHERRLQARMGF
jgi:hypothetical protein